MKNKKSLFVLNPYINKIACYFKPISIFLYGSRARNDYLNVSDYEVGILFKKINMIDEHTIAQIINNSQSIRIYPYELESFLNATLQIPFESSLFIRGIAITGKTLRGERIIENMKLPAVKVVNLLREIKFNLGRATAAIVAHRMGHIHLSNELFFKSCLWGARIFIIFSRKKFLPSYLDTYHFSNKINPLDYKKLISKAYKVRVGEFTADNDTLMENIHFLNKLDQHLLAYYNLYGDKIMLNSLNDTKHSF